MNTFTHEQVAQRAYRIWQNYGSPIGRDTEIWFEAERQLAAELSKSPSQPAPHATSQPANDSNGASAWTKRVQDEMASESAVEYQISPPIPEQEALQAALQKKEARAPKQPGKTAPKAAPPETGKPLWSKPHSS